MKNIHVQPVELHKAYRLVNHGPTVLVSARYDGVDNVMAVAWCCGLDIDPPKLMVVADSLARTRSLMEASGRFVVQVPTVAQLDLTQQVGTRSLHQDPQKLMASDVSLFDIPEQDLPFVEGCSAWLACRVIEEPPHPVLLRSLHCGGDRSVGRRTGIQGRALAL